MMPKLLIANKLLEVPMKNRIFFLAIIFFSFILTIHVDGQVQKEDMFNLIDQNEEGGISLWGFGLIRIIRGEYQLWKPNQLVLFRIDATYEGQFGKKGIAYRLDSEGNLKKVGSFNAELSSSEQ